MGQPKANSAVLPHTPAAARLTIEARMNSDLLEISKSWSKGISASNNLTLRECYMRSLDVVKVKADAKKYGDDAVGLLFDRHDISRDTIRDYENVGTRISRKTFQEIDKFNQEALDKGRLPLSFTHLIRAARIADDDVRDDILKQAREEGWGVARLGEEVTKLIKDDSSLSAGKIAAPTARPTAMTSKLQKQANELVSTLVDLDENLLPCVDSVKNKDLEQMLDNLESSRAALEVIKETIEDRLVTIDSAYQHIKRKQEQVNARKAVDDQLEAAEEEGGVMANSFKQSETKARRVVSKSAETPTAVVKKKKKRPPVVVETTADGGVVTATATPPLKKKKKRPTVVPGVVKPAKGPA